MAKKRKKKGLTPDERAEQDGRLRQLRDLIARAEAELEERRKAREQRAG